MKPYQPKTGTQKPTMPMTQILLDVARALRDRRDTSETTVRCAINDSLDQWDRDGYKVNHDYNQPQAVRRVQLLIEDYRRLLD